MGLGRCLWFISPPQLDKVEHRLSGVQSRGPHLPQFMALAWVGQCPMPLGPFVLQEYQRPSLVSTPQQRTYSWKFIKCAEQRPPFATVYGLGCPLPVPSDPFVLQEYQRPSPLRSTEHMHANLSDVQSRGHHLQEYPITGGPLHSTGGMHAYKIYLVCKADDTLATTCHSLWHCLGFNGLPNPLGPILQIYPNSISTAQGPHKRPEHPSHFHHHYQHLCSTLVRWNFVAHWSHKFMKQLHIGQFIRLVR